MMKCGARTGPADLMNVCQSPRDRGANNFVPAGQLILSLERRTVQQFSHFTNGPGEYGPLSVIRVHLHDDGLPFIGFVEISSRPVHAFGVTPLATDGKDEN
jgi:hypothetical protein